MINRAPKKRFSQNFLINEGVCKKISQILPLSGENILEIGPGKGAITKYLLNEKPNSITALEIDNNLIEDLKIRFKKETEEGVLKLINQDILKFELSNLENNYLAIANIPYHITGLIFRHLLTSNNKPKALIFLIQKEVAERIVANDKKESILSLSVKVFGDPQIVQIVKSGSFFPAPNVDSAIVLVNNIRNNVFKSKDQENLFFQIIKLAFGQKRKTLLKNLSSLPIVQDKAREIITAEKIEPNIRAEDISLDFWLKIINSL